MRQSGMTELTKRVRLSRTWGTAIVSGPSAVAICLGRWPLREPRAVGVRSKRARPRNLWICDGHLPAEALEGVVDEARPGHGLDDRADLLAVAQDPAGESSQGVRVWVNGQDLDCSPFLVEHVHIEPLARQVQSGVQHGWSLPVLVA